MSEHYNLDEAVRKVPNYPKEGIIFYDITGILTNPRAFGFCVDRMVEIYRERKIGAVAAIESRGFIFAAPLAARLGIPLILVRKAGKLPGAVYREDYHLEYGAAAVEIHESDVPRGREVLLIDDLIATGGTLHASRRILERGGARVNHVFGVIGLPFLHYREKLPGIKITTLIEYSAEKL